MKIADFTYFTKDNQTQALVAYFFPQDQAKRHPKLTLQEITHQVK
jgi:hypothetical protein